MTAPIRVLIADDQELLRGAFRLLIDSDPGLLVVGEAADGRAAIAASRELTPDIILMDVRMPGVDGIEATRVISADPHGPRIIVLTMFDEDAHVYGALRAGASAFLLKNTAPAELLRAIHIVQRGDALLAPEVTARLIDTLTATTPLGPTAIRDTGGITVDLTDRERETLTLIGRGLSNVEIAETLVLAPATARTYVSRLLSKLGARDRAQLVILAYESGLVGR